MTRAAAGDRWIEAEVPTGSATVVRRLEHQGETRAELSVELSNQEEDVVVDGDAEFVVDAATVVVS